MKSAIVHAVLLIGMLGFGYQTWTRDKSVKPSHGKVVVWNDKASDIQAIIMTTKTVTDLQTRDRTVRIGRADGGAGWWGSDVTATTRKKPAAQLDAPDPHDDPHAHADEPPPPAPAPDTDETETTTTSREFPVGAAADKLVAAYAQLRAERSLGKLADDQRAEYKLDQTDATIEIVFAGKTRTLTLGDKVLQGKNRYVLDQDSGVGYILSGDLIKDLEGGERSLVPDKPYPTEKVEAIEIAAGDRRKRVQRQTVKEAGKESKTWADESGKTDQDTAVFLTKVETSVTPTAYHPEVDPATLTAVVSLTYHDARGATLGTLTLYKRTTAAEPPPPPPEGEEPPPPPSPTTEYFVVSELTRVPAAISARSGEQVEQNVATVLAE
jgi:hypothetical protein